MSEVADLLYELLKLNEDWWSSINHWRRQEIVKRLTEHYGMTYQGINAWMERLKRKQNLQA